MSSIKTEFGYNRRPVSKNLVHRPVVARVFDWDVVVGGDAELLCKKRKPNYAFSLRRNGSLPFGP